MNPFQYVTAQTPEEAVSLVGKNGRYLGGGIDLLGEMKDYIVSPNVLVNVKNILPFKDGSIFIPDLSHAGSANGTGTVAQTQGNKSGHLSGNAIIAEVAAHEDVKKALPGLAGAAAEIGSPQIRNVATVAGNLLQHSRCWYYRQPDIVCLKRGGTTCYAQDGENKYSSLFSGCACISPVVSNLSVILSALDATAEVKRGGKIHKMSMTELYHEAWKDPLAHNSLKAEDFLTQVTLPLHRTRSAYRQVSEKSEFDWALVSCAAAGNVADGRITDARVALGAVAPVPYMVHAANEYLEGKPLTDEHASKAADIILKDAKPLAQNGYKAPLAHALIRRTLLALHS